jgi:hypothetical protein
MHGCYRQAHAPAGSGYAAGDFSPVRDQHLLDQHIAPLHAENAEWRFLQRTAGCEIEAQPHHRTCLLWIDDIIDPQIAGEVVDACE